MKLIFEIILATIIIFFLWNILKRLFFSFFFKFPPRTPQGSAQKTRVKKEREPKINWDAETVDYEEVPTKTDSSAGREQKI